ncbi:MAG: GNAT family N-acetyltransferase [Desulfobacterales bacterium]|jgi:GNAT superfamily N-acetyltransferase
MEFIEIRTKQEMEEAYEIIRELIPELDKEVFFKSLNHELLKNHKLFGLRSSEKLVSVAAVWLLMNGLFEKFLWLYAFATTKDMRSKGFGKELLRNLEAYAVRENFNEIRVHAHRERAIAFWENKANFELFSHVLRKKI